MIELDSYIAKAETALIAVLDEWRPKLMASHGIRKFDVKADSTVVTELDKSLELALKDALRPLSSEVGFLGEEHGPEGPSDIKWLVDPIDGTEQYVRGLLSCRTMLCLIMDGEPVYAFVYRFTTKDLFTAQKGKGAQKNNEPITLEPRELDRSWVEFAADLRNPGAALAMAQVDGAVNSVTYTKEFLYVLEGFIDAYVVYGGKGGVWDYAPRALLMQEAGLKITNLGSNSYDYKNLSWLAASPKVYDTLAKLLSPQA